MSESLDSFKKLKAWQEAHKLSVWIYEVIDKHPQRDQFGFASQVQRGSLRGLQNQPQLSLDVNRTSQEIYSKLNNWAAKSHKILQGLISSVQKICSK